MLTWGGLTFNRLLAALLEQANFGKNTKANDHAITGITDGHELTLSLVMELANREHEEQALPRKVISKFREPTRFFYDLSPELQRREEQNSVPILPFLRWIKQCEGIN